MIAAISAVVAGLIVGWFLGRARGWREARDLIVPRLDAERDRVERALLTSVRGGRA